MSYNILRINKPVGLTPIQCWLQFRSRNFLPDMKAIESQRLPKGAICGKLDPMAEGELIILLEKIWPNHLITSENLPIESIPHSIKGNFGQVMDSLCNHEKIYEFGLLIGISTDSDDRLGTIENSSFVGTTKPIDDTIVSQLKKELLNYAHTLKEQEYHILSAKRAQNKEGIGHNLWWWKQHNRLSEIEIPRHKCLIKEIEILEGTSKRASEISMEYFLNETLHLLKNNRENLLDFKVDNIIENWSNHIKAYTTSTTIAAQAATILPNSPTNTQSHQPLLTLPIINVRVRVTSGTFIRQICRDLIRKTGIPMLCTYIDRKQVLIV